MKSLLVFALTCAALAAPGPVRAETSETGRAELRRALDSLARGGRANFSDVLQDPPPKSLEEELAGRRARRLARADRPYWRRSFLRRMWGDQKYLVARWWPSEARDPWFSGPLVVSLAAGLGTGDEPGVDVGTETFLDEWLQGRAEGPARAVTDLGDRTLVLAVGAAWALSPVVGNERWSRTASLSAEALVNVAIWSTVLKSAGGRVRPGQGYRAEFFQYDAPSGVSNTSFPSGHTMAAFAVAAVVADEFRDRRWVRWTAYGLAGVVGASRVVLGRHYVSDVMAGAVLGRSLGRMVASRSRGELVGRDPAGPRWTPIVDLDRRAAGMSVRWSW